MQHTYFRAVFLSFDIMLPLFSIEINCQKTIETRIISKSILLRQNLMEDSM